jgi:hypothetical protein
LGTRQSQFSGFHSNDFAMKAAAKTVHFGTSSVIFLYELARSNHSPVEQMLRRLTVAWRSFGIFQRHIFDAKFAPHARREIATQVEQLGLLMNALEQELGQGLATAWLRPR